MTAYLAPIPTPDPATAQALLTRLRGPGCTTAYLAERIGCGRRAASAWARSVGAVELSNSCAPLWGMPDEGRKRRRVLNQARAGTYACASLDWAGGRVGGEGS